MMRKGSVIALAAVLVTALAGCGTTAAPAEETIPRRYVCQRPSAALVLDGRLDDEAWADAVWSGDFVDIEGDLKPAPLHRTRVAMLWDEGYFYIGARLVEPQLMAYLTERESIIFHENDFEVFIDPDGDSHRYVELEVNARGTIWDLLLQRPYRDGGGVDSAWNIEGLVYQYDLQGTLNDPSDLDEGWTLEIAIPWTAIEDFASHPGPPREGEQWRVNFSRVQWLWDVKDGRYVKRLDAAGKKLPEFNWVWSPQGKIAMHMPEMWGFVQFSMKTAGSPDRFVIDPEQATRDRLRAFYHAQRRFRGNEKRYCADLSDENFDRPEGDRGEDLPQVTLIEKGYRMSLPRADGAGRHHIDESGRLWSSTD